MLFFGKGILVTKRKAMCLSSLRSYSQLVILVSPARSPIMNCPPTTVPSLLRMALPLLYILRRAMVSADLMLESLPWPFGARRPCFDEALDRLSMLVLPLAGACFVYFHPVLGMVAVGADAYIGLDSSRYKYT